MTLTTLNVTGNYSMTLKDFKPMLASPADLDTLRFPLIASPKIDGIRAMVRGGRLVSRKLLDLPNLEIQATLCRPEYEGMDGEIVVGPLTAKDAYLQTVSFVMAPNKEGAAWRFHVFDLHDSPLPFCLRYDTALVRVMKASDSFVDCLPHTHIESRERLDVFEADCVDRGFEGVMTRDPNALYKYGRSTAKEQILLKVKRFEDSEAEIIGVQEEMYNGNIAGRDELGRTKRSTAQAGKTGKGTMGALLMRDIHSGVEFSIGTGFTAAQRAENWHACIGQVRVYKFFPVGVKDKPRHPVDKGPRSKIDIGTPA